MRKTLLILAAAAMAVCSCNKSEVAQTKGKPVEVTVQINGSSMTRTVGNTYANESKVNTLQILAFNASGQLEGYKAVSKEMSVTLMASAGQKTVWAVVNAPSLEKVQTLNELTGTLSGLADNATDSFVMTGSLTTELTDGAVVAITVKRLVARVSVGKISVEFPETPAYAGKDLRLTGIYMINVANTVNFALGGEPTDWYNKLAHTDAQVDALLYDAVGETLSNHSSHTTEHAFYPYPNPVAKSVKEIPQADRGTWSPRRSILVIEVVFDGKTGYYPIELPVIDRNKTYGIDEVKITRSPGAVPYDPIETGEATVSITVADWELGLNLGTITI